jgi:hypothetical protein
LSSVNGHHPGTNIFIGPMAHGRCCRPTSTRRLGVGALKVINTLTPQTQTRLKRPNTPSSCSRKGISYLQTKSASFMRRARDKRFGHPGETVGVIPALRLMQRGSGMGHEQTWRHRIVMSPLPPKADIDRQPIDVRFVPQADIRRVLFKYLSARASMPSPRSSGHETMIALRSILHNLAVVAVGFVVALVGVTLDRLFAIGEFRSIFAAVFGSLVICAISSLV